MDIIYFKPSNSTFVLADQGILERHFAIKTYYINNKNGLIYFFSLIKLFFFMLLFGWQPKIYFIRFADWHTAMLALFAKIFRKKLDIVIGGFDAFHYPELNYGVYNRKFRGWCAAYSIRNASYVLPNSPDLIESTNYYAFSSPVKGGIKHFVPDIKGKIKIVHNGFDPCFWDSNNLIEKKNIIISVANVKTLRTFYLKGIDVFIELAKILPQYKFRIVGLNKEFVSQNQIEIPENTDVVEFVPHHILKNFYLEARVFCILSLTEGMSNVLCEAMLCECIPVGSNVTFIPEVIGNTGFIIKNKDINEIKEAVLKAVNSNSGMGKLAKKRIIENYSLEKREHELCEIIKEQLH